MKIVCVGGGPASLFFAALMKKNNPEHDIAVVERNPAGVAQGWGVVFWEDLLASLQQSDPEIAQEIAAAAYQWHGLEVTLGDQATVAPDATGFSIARTRLISLLAEKAQARGVRVEFGRELDASELPADVDLVVAGDGMRSKFRTAKPEQFGTELVTGENVFVWLGSTKEFTNFTFAFVESPAGLLWSHTYGYEEGRSTFIVECRPETWRGLGLDQLPVDESLALLEQLFAAHLDGHRLLVQGRTPDQPMPWQTFTTVRNTCWHNDAVVLMGDAAHTTHFSIGSGTKLALEDAMELAAAFGRHDSVGAALAEYDTHRRQTLEWVQREARYSARWLENVPRYAGAGIEQFSALMDQRRSRALAHLPLPLYLRLRTVVGVGRRSSQAVAGVNSAMRTSIRRRISSRIGRTDSTPLPAGSSSTQSS